MLVGCGDYRKKQYGDVLHYVFHYVQRKHSPYLRRKFLLFHQRMCCPSNQKISLGEIRWYSFVLANLHVLEPHANY